MEFNHKLNDSIFLPREKEAIRRQDEAVKNFKFVSRCYEHVEALNKKTGQRFVFRY